MIKSNIVVAAGKIKKSDEAETSSAEKSSMEAFKLHIGCIDPLSKAIQSMKDCYEDLADDGLKKMLMDCIEGISKIEEALLAKAGEALKSEIVSIRSKSQTGIPSDISTLADQIAGKVQTELPAEATPAPAAVPEQKIASTSEPTHGQKS